MAMETVWIGVKDLEVTEETIEPPGADSAKVARVRFMTIAQVFSGGHHLFECSGEHQVDCCLVLCETSDRLRSSNEHTVMRPETVSLYGREFLQIIFQEDKQ